MRLLRMSVMLLVLLPTRYGTAAAQKLTLTLNSGSPVAFPAPTETDYDGGSVTATAPLAFTVDLNSGPPGVNRTSIVAIRAGSALMGGSKPISDLQWRRSDLGTWNGLTTTNVTVESRLIVRNAANDPWSNSIVFRTLLDWTIDGPAAYAPTIIMTVTLTTP
jgi:hypothetical protein